MLLQDFNFSKKYIFPPYTVDKINIQDIMIKILNDINITYKWIENNFYILPKNNNPDNLEEYVHVLREHLDTYKFMFLNTTIMNINEFKHLLLTIYNNKIPLSYIKKENEYLNSSSYFDIRDRDLYS